MRGKASAFKTAWIIVWAAVRSVLRRPGAALALSVIPVALMMTRFPLSHFHHAHFLPDSWVYLGSEDAGYVFRYVVQMFADSLFFGVQDALYLTPAVWGWLQLMDGKRLYDCFPQTMFRSAHGYRLALYLVALFSLQRFLQIFPIPFKETLSHACFGYLGAGSGVNFQESDPMACLLMQVQHFLTLAVVGAILIGMWIAIIEGHRKNAWTSPFEGWRRTLRFPGVTLLIGVITAVTYYVVQTAVGFVNSAVLSVLVQQPGFEPAGPIISLLPGFAFYVVYLIWVGVALGAWHVFFADKDTADA